MLHTARFRFHERPALSTTSSATHETSALGWKPAVSSDQSSRQTGAEAAPVVSSQSACGFGTRSRQPLTGAHADESPVLGHRALRRGSVAA